MILDARDLPDRSELRADVCVVGAGPVGLAAALALAAGGLDVVQLDSGGPEHDPAADALGEPASIEFGTVTRLGHTRRIGGNAHAWQVRTGLTHRGVRMIPLQGAELDSWPGDPGGGWPVGGDELARYLARAQAWLGLPARDYDAASWAGADTDQVVRDPAVRSAVFQFADGGRLAADAVRLATESSVRLAHHATAAEILTTPDGARATGVRAVSLPGRELTVRADHVVLAAGAMATTQLLLASDAARSGGLGNTTDQLGRHLMDHLLLQGGELWPADPGDIARRTLYDLRLVAGTPVMGHLALTDEVVRAEGLAALSLLLYPREADYLRRRSTSTRQQDGVRGALAIREAVLRRNRPPRGTVRQAVVGLDGVLRRAVGGGLHPESSLGRGGWSAGDLHRLVCFEVLHQAEQGPHPDNRVTLTDRLDALGQRRIAIDWRWHDGDVDAVRRAQDVYVRALARNGWGQLRPWLVDGRPVVRSSSSHHFMGTTRMSTDPRHGVVDADCAVHGTPNLLVASSSTFPRGGYANVTLTALALGLRVADRVLRATGAVPASGPAPVPAHDPAPAGGRP